MVSTSSCFVNASTIKYIYFPAQLNIARQELQDAQDAAAAQSRKDEPQVECPAKIGKLQNAMGLQMKYWKYFYFRMSFYFSCKVYCN